MGELGLLKRKTKVRRLGTRSICAQTGILLADSKVEDKDLASPGG